MKRYRTKKTLRIYGGRVGLSEDQAHRRRMSIKPIGRDVYEVMRPVEFKAGEIIGLDAVSKSMGGYVDDLAAAARAEKKAAKKPDKGEE